MLHTTLSSPTPSYHHERSEHHAMKRQRVETDEQWVARPAMQYTQRPRSPRSSASSYSSYDAPYPDSYSAPRTIYSLSHSSSVFAANPGVKAEMEVHSEDNDQRRNSPSCQPAQCDICGKKLSRAGDMPRHKKTHLKDKKAVLHYCPLCNFSSIQKGNVTVHIRTHTGEKPLNCPDCEESFADPGSLTRHRKRKHNYVPEPRAARDAQAPKPAPSSSTSWTGLRTPNSSFEASTLDLLKRSQQISNAAIEKERLGNSAEYNHSPSAAQHALPTEMLTLTPSGTYSRPTMSQRMSPPETFVGSSSHHGATRRPEMPRLYDALWTPAPSRGATPEHRSLKRSRSPSVHSRESRDDAWANESASWNRSARMPEAKRYTPLTPDSPSVHEPSTSYGEYPSRLRLHTRERNIAPLDDSSDVEDAHEFSSAVRFPMSVVRGGS